MLRDLLHELKTSHAIHQPTAEMEKKIADEMAEIRKLFAGQKGSKEEAHSRILNLKKNIRTYLYEAP